MRALLVVAVAVVAVSCGADDDALSPSASSAGAREVGRPRMRDASYDPVVPFESLGDWVSYGDLVVVATVTGEVPADPTDELGAMGWPSGQSIVIDERVWQHPSAPIPPDNIEFSGGLLVVEPGRRPSLSLVLATVGAHYLVALGRYDDGGWMPVAPMLEIVDGRSTRTSPARTRSPTRSRASRSRRSRRSCGTSHRTRSPRRAAPPTRPSATPRRSSRTRPPRRARRHP
jgi:hypothetical protein